MVFGLHRNHTINTSLFTSMILPGCPSPVQMTDVTSSELSETSRLYCSWDAVLLRYRQEGLDVGLINKSTPNLVGEHTLRKIGSSSFMLVIESLNRKTAYAYMDMTKDLDLSEQIPHQNFDPQCSP
ncbi:hypothetical protein EV424DRAFT_1343499 [Suillus variegatus]|nr:hypothetical protein EV424DRAFT_1343499 [Suillus variegatus]